MQALQQRVVQHGLSDRFGRMLVPSEVVIDPRTKRKITRRFYPGYMLCEMVLDNETWHLVKNTPKITGFVGGTRSPSTRRRRWTWRLPVRQPSCRSRAAIRR